MYPQFVRHLETRTKKLAAVARDCGFPVPQAYSAPEVVRQDRLCARGQAPVDVSYIRTCVETINRVRMADFDVKVELDVDSMQFFGRIEELIPDIDLLAITACPIHDAYAQQLVKRARHKVPDSVGSSVKLEDACVLHIGQLQRAHEAYFVSPYPPEASEESRPEYARIVGELWRMAVAGVFFDLGRVSDLPIEQSLAESSKHTTFLDAEFRRLFYQKLVDCARTGARQVLDSLLSRGKLKRADPTHQVSAILSQMVVDSHLYIDLGNGLKLDVTSDLSKVRGFFSFYSGDAGRFGFIDIGCTLRLVPKHQVEVRLP